MKFDTKVIHAGQAPDPRTGAVMTPIYATSTYAQSSPGEHPGYDYARTRNPTRDALEACLAALLRALPVRQVTSLLVKETDKLIAPTLDFSADPLSVLAENVILLHQVPFEGELHRVLSIPKVRLSAHDTALRDFRIAAPRGLEVLGFSESQAGVLEGITRAQDQVRLPTERNAKQSTATENRRQRGRGHAHENT